MIFLQRPKNVKVCPGCGTCQIHTATHCAVCGYHFTAANSAPSGRLQITLSLPAFFGLILVLLAINTLVILGLERREQTTTQVLTYETTATFVATSFVSPTPAPTETRTPGPPTETPVVEIEYIVVEGDSCLSIADRFDIYLDRLLLANNDLDCSLLTVGTVLTIPPSRATPEPTGTAAGASQP